VFNVADMLVIALAPLVVATDDPVPGRPKNREYFSRCADPRTGIGTSQIVISRMEPSS